MARLRYVKSTDSRVAPKSSGSAIRHQVESLRAIYETEPEIARALVPRPLEPAESPEIFVQFANVAMHFPDERVVEIGAATVGVACIHEGRRGYYVLAMPMEGECVVIGVPDREGLTKPWAFVVAEEESSDLEQELKELSITGNQAIAGSCNGRTQDGEIVRVDLY